VRIKLSIYFFAKVVGLFALCRMLTKSRIRILGYHGACLDDESNYNPILFLSAKTFRRRIDWLVKKGFNVIPLQHAVDGLAGTADVGRLPTVITFDDGWHSTGERLVPVLAEAGLPSTLYLHTSHFEEDWPVLTVTVNYMIWKSNRQSIHVHGLGADVDGSYDLAETADRESFHRKSCQWLVGSDATRERVIERIHQLANSMELDVHDLGLETRRFDYMSRDELLQLTELGCAVEMHGHQHHYPTGDPEAFAADLTACRKVIMKLGLSLPQHYCYPSGSFDSAAAETLKRLEVQSATTCIPGLVRLADDDVRRYFLPRFLDAEHISMLTFEAELSGFADLLRHAVGR
jgi:peptidoglycan/xylan/chitin deacetylase (PgdA/CDA1 family)